jgi:protein-S-isoprenylcysteine O-methyltransferase Ste14
MARAEGDDPVVENQKMNALNIKALAGLLQLLVIMALLIFVPAGTLDYPQAWIFLVVFFAPVLTITIYLMKNDPKLLERRISAGPSAEKEKSQKIIQFFAMADFIAVMLIPAFDHRFGWSAVPPYVSVVGNILVVLGFLIVFLTFKENTYTSAIIEVDAGQKIISTGPYAHVRHPMYIGALIMLVGVPLALGSWWGLLTVVAMTLVIVWRLLGEEKFLARNLAGYSQYQNAVRYRLLPFVW